MQDNESNHIYSVTDCAPIRSFEVFGKNIAMKRAHFEVILRSQTINETNEFDTILPIENVNLQNFNLDVVHH